MNIGENIKKARISKGLTQKQLGEILGISQSAITQFENNRSNPKYDTLQKIATALNVNVEELMGLQLVGPGLKVFQNSIKKQNDLVKRIINIPSIELESGDEVILSYFHDLNDTGKDKLVDYAADLVDIPKYKKQSDYTAPSAAHNNADTEE